MGYQHPRTGPPLPAIFTDPPPGGGGPPGLEPTGPPFAALLAHPQLARTAPAEGENPGLQTETDPADGKVAAAAAAVVTAAATEAAAATAATVNAPASETAAAPVQPAALLPSGAAFGDSEKDADALVPRQAAAPVEVPTAPLDPAVPLELPTALDSTPALIRPLPVPGHGLEASGERPAGPMPIAPPSPEQPAAPAPVLDPAATPRAGGDQASGQPAKPMLAPAAKPSLAPPAKPASLLPTPGLPLGEPEPQRQPRPQPVRALPPLAKAAASVRPSAPSLDAAPPDPPAPAGPVPGGQPTPASSAPPAPAAAPAAPPAPAPAPAAAVEAVVRLAARQGFSRARLTLKPAELGSVEVLLRTSAGGVTASVLADTPEAARQLQSAAADLRHQLAGQGLELQALTISVAQDAPGGAEGRPQWRQAAPATAIAAGGDGPGVAEAQPQPIRTIELGGGVLVDVLA